MAEVLWRYEGDDITHAVEFRSCRAQAVANGQVGRATLRVRDRGHVFDPGYFHAGGTLELWIDGERQWDGWVFDVRREWAFDVDDTRNPVATPRFWALVGLDRNLLFQRRYLFNQSHPTRPFPDFDEGVYDREALLEVATNWVDLSGDGLDLGGITQVDIPGQGEKYVLGEIGSMWGLAFEDCSKITGAVYYIDPDRVVRYVDDQTVTAPFVLSDNPAATDGAIGYREVEDVDDGMEMANDAFVWGAGRGNASPVFHRYTNEELVELYGLWQWADQVVGAARQETVRKRARTYVEGSPEHNRGHGDPIPTVRLVTFQTGFRVAQVARFIHEIYDVDRPLPIRSMTIDFPTQSDPRFEMELSLRYDTPFMRVDPWLAPPPEEPDPESHPPTGGEATVIDEFDREEEFVWGTATGGGVWPTQDQFVQYPAQDEPSEGSLDGVNVGLIDTGVGSSFGFSGGLDAPRVKQSLLTHSGSWPITIVCRVRGLTSGSFDFTPKLQMTLVTALAYSGDLLDHVGFQTIVGPDVEYASMEADWNQWHIASFEFGVDSVARAKVWLEGADEPDWMAEASFESSSYSFDGIMLTRFFVMPAGGDFQVDWIRSGDVLLGGTGTADTQNEAFNWDGGNLYQTAYPYLVGTLRIWLDGVALRWGIDYFESDPDHGEFRLTPDFLDMAQADVSDRLTVRYRRDVSYPSDFKEGPHRTPSPEGYTGSRVYRPQRQRQMGWGTRYDGVNCTAASAAMGLDRDSVGALSPSKGSPRATPPNIREFSGITAVEGLSMTDIGNTWSNGWSRTLNYFGLVSFGTFEGFLNEGRGSVVMGLYSVLQERWPSLAFSRTFYGPHAMYVNEQYSDGSFVVYDPLANRVLVYEREQLRAYMQSWTSNGLCNASFTRATDIS